MSQTIDNRIVQLEFDNADFEEGVGESLSTLEKLKKNLNLDGAAKALTALGAAAGKFNLDGISYAVQEVGDKFSYMKYAGLVAIENLVTSAMNAGSRIVSSLTGPIISGGWTRALNLEQANFMMKGLLDGETEIEAVMKNVSDAVDGTAYSLDAAAKVAAQFTASGMEAGDSMEMALKAIAGTAAMTNSSFEEIGDIFTTVKGQGKLMAYQMNQLSFRGLNTAATLGKALNKSEEEIRDMVSKGKISFDIFSQAMYDAFGEHAKEANSTFSGAMSNVRAALGRIGAEFATPFINNVIPVLNAFRLAINATKATLTPFFEAASAGMEWLSRIIQKSINSYTDYVTKFSYNIKKVFSNVILIIRNIFSVVKGMTSPIKEAFRDIFPQKNTLLILQDLSTALVDITKKIKQLYFESGAADTIKLAFKGFFSIFDTGKVIISRIIDLIKQFAPIFDGFGGTITKVITKVSEFLLGVNESIKDSNFLIYDLSGVVDKIKEIKDHIKEVFNKVKSTIEEVMPKLEGVKDFLTMIFDKVKEYLSRIIDGIKDIAGKDIFSKVIDHIKNGFTGLISGISGLISKVTEKLSGATSVLPNIFDAISRAIASILTGILNGISGFLSSKQMSDLTKSLKNGAIIKAFWDFGKSMDSLNTVLTNLNPRKLIDSFTGLSGVIADSSLISSLAKSILMLAGAMFIMSIIDVDRFNAALDALKSMMRSIMAVLVIMKLLVPLINLVGKGVSKHFKKVWENIIPDQGFSTAGIITAIGASILMLSLALVALSKVDTPKLVGATIALELLLVTLTGAAVVITKTVGEMAKQMALYDRSFKSFKAITKPLSKLLLSIAASMMILVVSLKLLASIPFTSMVKALIGLTVIFGELAAFTVLMNTLDIGKTVGPAILKISVGLLIMAAALKILASIPFTSMVKALIALSFGLAAMTVSLIALANMMTIFSNLKLGNLNFTKLASAILIVSISLIALAAALKIMSTIKPETLGNTMMLLAVGMIAMTGSLIVLAFAVAGLEKNISVLRKVNLPAIAASMLILSASLIAMALAMKVISSIDMDSFDLLIIFAGGLASMVIALRALATIQTGKLIAAAASIAIISLSIIGLASAMALLAHFSFDQLATSLIFLTGALMALALIAGVIGTQIEFVALGALGILAVFAAIAGGVALIGKAFQVLGKGLVLIGDGLAKVGVGLTIVAGAIAKSLTETFSKLTKDLKKVRRTVAILALLGTLSPLIILLGVSLLSVGAGFSLIGKGAEILGKGLDVLALFMLKFVTSLRNIGRIITDSKKQISAFIGLILKLALLSLVSPLLFVFAAGLIAVGAALMIFGAGLTLVMSGIALFATALEKLTEINWAAIGEVIDTIFESIKLTIQAFIDWIKNIDWAAIWDGIKNAAQSVINWFENIDWKAVGTALLNAIKNVIAKITELHAKFHVWLGEKLLALWELIKGKLNEAWINLRTAISEIWEELKTTLQARWEEVLANFDGWRKDLVERGRNVILGFIEGINERWDDIKSIPDKIRNKILGGIDEGFDINSPSKETWYRGLFIGEGLVRGTEEGLDGLDGVIDGAVDKTLGKFGGLGSKIHSIFGRDIKESAEEADNSLSKLIGTITDGTNFEWRETIPALTETWNTLGDLIIQLQQADEDYAKGKLSEEAYASMSESLKGKIEELIGSFENLKEAQDAIATKIYVLKNEQKELGDAFAKGTMPASEFALRLKNNSDALKTLKEVQAAYKTETKQAKEATDKQSEALDKNTTSTDSNTKSKKSATKANEDFASSLEKTLTNQLNLFSKFEAKNPMNKEELLNNMRSQIKGMTDWAGQMKKLAEMGIDQGLYKKLAEMGPQGAEYVGAFAAMTAEEMAQANEMWAQSLVLPGDVAKDLSNTMNNFGQGAVQGFVNGVAGTTGEVTNAMTDMSQEAVDATHDGPLDFGSPSHTMQKFGMWVDLGLAQGITLNMHFPLNAIETMCNLIVDKARKLLDPDVFKPIGVGIVEGIQKGIDDNKSIVEKSVESLAKLIEDALTSKKGLDINSPSKKMIPIGMEVDEGLAVGITKGGSLVSDSIEDMSDNAIEAMRYTVANIASMINDEMQDPVITPILDLSNVQAGVRRLNSTFSTNQALRASSALSNLQNGQSNAGGVQFIQNNYSPKTLSRVEIYRQTRNQLAQYKQAMS